MGFTVGVEVTRRCNFTCPHCFVSAGRGTPDELTTAEIKALLGDLAACGVSTVGWSGGEPLLRKDLEELSTAASERGLSQGLASNGFLASRKRLAGLKACGLGVLQVSLDGVSAELAGRFRRGPSTAFERAVQALRDAAELGIETYVCCLLAPESAAEIEGMIALARELGACGLRYTMWAPVGRATGQTYDELAWARPEVAAFLRHFDRQRRRDGFRLLIDCPTGPHPYRTGFSCQAGPGSAYITAAGDIYPCTALMDPSYLVGNIRERPVADLLFDGAMFKVRREIAHSLPGGACADCPLLPRCRGGCPGRTLAAFGQVRGGDHDGALPACLYRLHTRTG